MIFIKELQPGLIRCIENNAQGNIKENIKNGNSGTEEEKRVRRLRAAASRLRTWILANITPYCTRFLTLTYADDRCSEQDFIKQTEKYFNRKVNEKYVYVYGVGLENRRLHVHALIFSEQNIVVPDWEYGDFSNEQIDDQIFAIANYFARQITIAINDHDYDLPIYIKRRYRCSRGLNKPKKIEPDDFFDSFDNENYEIVNCLDLVFNGVVVQKQAYIIDKEFYHTIRRLYKCKKE